jgi:hypothetical protein
MPEPEEWEGTTKTGPLLAREQTWNSDSRGFPYLELCSPVSIEQVPVSQLISRFTALLFNPLTP